ncbi:MAG TPA: hypothetical protein VM345_11150 [Acidimicrobiales bacterium]|jgi:plastocyanin|nr:hypothetical protein [Acidimicrobiales bacterium]
MSIRRTTSTVLLLIVAFVGAACSDDTEVGTSIDTDPLKGKLEDFNTTTTAAPVADAGAATTAPPATVATTAAPTTAPPTTAAPRVTTTTADPAFVITINGDKSGQPQIEPTNARVRVGTPVRFVNNDSQTRGVYSREAGFSSPEIPPGGSFTWTPQTAGSFPLRDPTRPYVTATIEVV